MQTYAMPTAMPSDQPGPTGHALPSGVPAVQARASDRIDLRGRKILIIEDDRLNLLILKEIFKGEGFTLCDADSAEKALELYETFKPDLVLLDVMLPGMDGFECCRELHHRHGESTCPIVFITAKAESEDVVQGFASGGIDYLPKPFRRRESIARIRTHLHTRMLMEEQKHLVQQLSHANAAKNRLLGMAAHDLRNPLASIRGLAEFLKDGTVGPLSADQLDLVETIHETSQSMLTLLGELLDTATVEAGELKINREATDFPALINKSVYLNNINAAKKGTRILICSECPTLTIPLDASKIKQVVDNLLSNAVKYSPPKSTIRVKMAVSTEQVRLIVEDEGPGIPPDEHHKLFKDFTTLSVKPTGGEKATGLGLAICRKIIDAHGGTIEASNLPTKGCQFSITLPFS